MTPEPQPVPPDPGAVLTARVTVVLERTQGLRVGWWGVAGDPGVRLRRSVPLFDEIGEIARPE